MPKSKSKKTKFSKKRNRYLQQEFTNIHNLDQNVPSVRSHNGQCSLPNSAIIDKFTIRDIELTGDSIFNSSRGTETTHNLDLRFKSMEESDLKIEDPAYFMFDDDTRVTQSSSQISSHDDCASAVNSDPSVLENGYMGEIELSEACYSETTVNDKKLPLEENSENGGEGAPVEEDLEATRSELNQISNTNNKSAEKFIHCDEPGLTLSPSTEDVEIPIEPLSQEVIEAFSKSNHVEPVSPSASASLNSLLDEDNVSVFSKDTDTTEEVLHFFGKPPASHSSSTSCSSLSDTSCFKLDIDDDLESTMIDHFDANELNTSVSLGCNTCSTLEKRDPKSYLRQRSVKRSRAKSVINPVFRNKPDGLKWPKKSSSGNLASWLDSAERSVSCWSQVKLKQLENHLDATEDTVTTNSPRKSSQTTDLNAATIAVEESTTLATLTKPSNTVNLSYCSTAIDETKTQQTPRKSLQTLDVNTSSSRITAEEKAISKSVKKPSHTSDLNFPSSTANETRTLKTVSKSPQTSGLNCPHVVVEQKTALNASRKSSETSDLNNPSLASEETETTSRASRKSSETSDLNIPSLASEETETTSRASRKSSENSDLNIPSLAVEETSPKTSRKSSQTSDVNIPNNYAVAAEEKKVHPITQKHSKHSSLSNPNIGPISPSLAVVQTKRYSKSISFSGLPSTPTSSRYDLGARRVLELSDDQSTEAEGLAEDLAACKFETDSERGTTSDMTMVSCRFETDSEIGAGSDETEMLSCRFDTDSERGMMSEITDTAACRFETDSDRGTLSEMSDIIPSDGFLTAVESRESRLSSTAGRLSLVPSHCSELVPFYGSPQIPRNTEGFAMWGFVPITELINFFCWIGLKIKSMVRDFLACNADNSHACPCHQANSVTDMRLEVVEKELRKLQDLIIALSEKPPTFVPIIQAGGEDNRNISRNAPPPPPLPPPPPPPPPPPMMANADSLWKPIKAEKSLHSAVGGQSSRMQITVEDLQRVALKKTPSMASNKSKRPQQNGPVVSLEMLRSVKLRSFQHRRASQERNGSRVRKSSRSPRDRNQNVVRDPPSRGASRTLLTIESDPTVEDVKLDAREIVPLAKSMEG